jgi:3-hydroxyisobutyrate dehydrogenase
MLDSIRPVGFVGLGVMGAPMALNLLRASTPLLVWNRSPDRARALVAAGAQAAAGIAEVFSRADIVILMLADEDAVDAVLQRREGGLARLAAGRTIVHMGTTAPAYSRALERDIRSTGGQYVEAPVSGSRKPAEAGQLVAMLAGAPDAVARVRPVLQPMCRKIVLCGAVPTALVMKLAVNIFLLTTVTGLAETVNFARSYGLDLEQVAAVLGESQMASEISRVKMLKLLHSDFSAQAAIADVLKNSRLIAAAAREAGIASPLIDACHELYRETLALGHGSADMIAVVAALAARGSG